MFYDWFIANISNTEVYFNFTLFQLEVYVNMASLFAFLMFFLFLWAAFHLTTDIIMAFRVVFGFGYKKRKGGSH